jgi:HTH-type transcriptional regulator/antitoxin HigA
MDIRPIATEAEYKRALAEIERLWDSQPGTPERGLLDVWAMLAQHYEREREPLPPVDPVEAIKLRLEQLGLQRKALLPIFGSAGRISEILARKRTLTLAHVAALHSMFQIPFECLIVAPKKRSLRRKRRGARKAA